MRESGHFEVLPEEYWGALQEKSEEYRSWLGNVRNDPNLSVRLLASEGKLGTFSEEEWGRLAWFLDWLERKLETFRIPQMLSVYKSETGERRINVNSADFAKVIEGAPDWKKRQNGLRPEMVRDFLEFPTSEFLHHRAAASFTYLLTEGVDLVENHKGFTSAKEADFKRLMRDDPVEIPPRNVYQYLSTATISILLLKGKEDFAELIDSFRPVYEFMGQVRTILENPEADQN